LEFEAALLKGRSNYLCLRKLAHLRLRGGLSEAEIGLLAKILVWLPSTVSGDQAELNLVEEEQRIWARLSAEEPCEAERCPHFERCFFYRARRRAEAAHLIVVNHSLLLSDMMTENRVLPRYSHLIIDEAHHLEDRATEQLSVEVGQRWLYFLLDGIASGSGRGLLNYLPLFLKGASSPFRREVEGYAADLKEEVARTRGTMEAFLSALSTFLNQHRRGNGRYDEHIRLTSALRAQPGWAQVEIAWEPLSSRLARIAQGLETLHQGVMSLGEREKHEDLLLELAQSGQEVHNLKEELEAIIAQPSPERIYWATMAARDKSLSLHDAPRQVAPLLWERLLSPQESLILTSATLRTGEGFAYIRERLGLEGAEEMALGSPFNYGDSTLLFIPTDIPEPNAPGYLQAAQEALWALSLATQGRILVLFTSWADLRSTHEALAGPLAERGIQLLGQGIDGSRHLVLEGFRAHPKSVLLGTRSFWEGIDVMGEALSCLVMARLPFPVPDDPIIAARSESYEDPFGQYHLPQAVLRFRQGFGRLIRSKSDRGVVVVLDKRMVTKYYGATFLASLPDCTIQQGSVTELPQVAAQWINRPKE
jgi:DNA polymerase-3 subunit epsilon/ATP-dependent DNA helicase DinG